MKKILIATDLSTLARNATDYALLLAADLQAHVTLMNAYELMPIMAPDSLAVLTISDVRDLTQQRLQEEIDNLIIAEPKAIDIQVEEGNTTTAILKGDPAPERQSSPDHRRIDLARGGADRQTCSEGA